MIRLILILILLLLASNGWGATKIDTTDYLNMRVLGADSSHLYGVLNGAASRYLYRAASKDATPSQIYDFGATYNTVLQVWTTTTAGEVFVLVENSATTKYYLYKSIDYGAHFGNNSPTFADGDYVLILGDTDTTETNQIASVYLLDRGFEQVSGTYYVGEYNVNGSRTPGGVNDQVRLMKSTDNGTTWSEVAHWNTDGSNTNVRHIHAVQASGTDLYISFGDTDAQSGILLWNGSDVISSNVNLSTYSNCLYGAQRYRTGDILFPTGSYAYYMADSAADDAERGIWRIPKDMSGAATRVDSTITSYANHSGWYGVLTSTGNMYFTEFLESGATDQQINFYNSADSGATWTIVAKYGATSAPGGAASFFERSGLLYYVRPGAGKNAVSTTIATEQGTYAESEPVILHPVYYVATGGTNNTTYPNGYRPTTPWLTAAYALTGDHITYGARVIFTGTLDDENAILADWNGNALPGTGTVVLEGGGMSNTLIRHKVADNATYTLYLSDTAYPTLVKNIAFDDKSATLYMVQQRAGTTGTFRGVKFGSATYDRTTNGAQLYMVGASNTVSKCWFEGPATNTDGFTIGANSLTVSVTDSVFNGLDEISYVNGRTGTTFRFDNNTAYNYDNRGIVFGSGTTFTSLSIRNNIFYGQATNNDIVDAATLTETDEQINYNYYRRGVTLLANSGGTNRLTYASNGDAGFRSVATSDFSLLSSSPCINAGTDVSLTTDFLGNAIQGYPDIGAYEYRRTLGVGYFGTSSGGGYFGFGFFR